MKKSIIFIIIILVLGVFILLEQTIYPKYYLEFPADGCLLAFDCTPSEFLDKDFDFYDEVGDLRKTASIDKASNSIKIYFSKLQGKKWLESGYFISFDEIKDKPYIKISPDLSSLTLYVTPEVQTMIRDNPKTLENLVARILYKIEIHKTLDGVPYEEISITYIEKDPNTGKILDTMILAAGKTVIFEDR